MCNLYSITRNVERSAVLRRSNRLIGPRSDLGGVVAVDTDEATIDLDADKGLVKGDAQTLGEIDDSVTCSRPILPMSIDLRRLRECLLLFALWPPGKFAPSFDRTGRYRPPSGRHRVFGT